MPSPASAAPAAATVAAGGAAATSPLLFVGIAVVVVALIGGAFFYVRSDDGGGDSSPVAVSSGSGSGSGPGSEAGSGTESGFDTGAGFEMSGEPTAETYCAAYISESRRLIDKYEAAGERIENAEEDDWMAAFEALGLLGGMPSDLQLFFAHLAAASPPEIRPEVEALEAGFGGMASSAGDNAGDIIDDPLTGMFSTFADSLMLSFQLNEPAERVDEYTRANCDLSEFEQ